LKVFAPAKAQRRKGAKAQQRKNTLNSFDFLGALAPLREIFLQLHHYLNEVFS